MGDYDNCVFCGYFGLFDVVGSDDIEDNEDYFTCPRCGRGLVFDIELGFLSPENSEAYDCSKMSDNELVEIRDAKYKMSGLSNQDLAEIGAYRDAIQLEIEKRK